jgi:hypothetical protein
LTDAYQRLLTLAKLEHELAVQGDLEGMERLDAERRQVVAGLPAKPPAAAKPLLVEMARIQADTTAVLTEARKRISEEMGEVDRTSETARSYGRQATPRGGTFTAAA